MVFAAWYMRDDCFRDFSFGDKLPDMANLMVSHTFLREVEADNLDDVFYQSQGEIWSPHGEARSLIRSKGLAHTSMSVGDLIEDTDAVFHMVSRRVGFKRLGPRADLPGAFACKILDIAHHNTNHGEFRQEANEFADMMDFPQAPDSLKMMINAVRHPKPDEVNLAGYVAHVVSTVVKLSRSR